jgi:hypothetical protein
MDDAAGSGGAGERQCKGHTTERMAVARRAAMHAKDKTHGRAVSGRGSIRSGGGGGRREGDGPLALRRVLKAERAALEPVAHQAQ